MVVLKSPQQMDAFDFLLFSSHSAMCEDLVTNVSVAIAHFSMTGKRLAMTTIAQYWIEVSDDCIRMHKESLNSYYCRLQCGPVKLVLTLFNMRVILARNITNATAIQFRNRSPHRALKSNSQIRFCN